MGISGILLLDKDQDWTSQDAVSKLRGILRERRIGHAGTLDPLATGLLVILVGRATRAAEYAEAEMKEYIAAFRPCIVTDTQDITGNILSSSAVLPTEEQVRAVLGQFTGPIEQIPPMYSAIKINGQKLYDIARRGGVSCACGSKRWSFQLQYSAVELSCSECGAQMRIPAATADDIDDICCKTSILIRGKGRT